MMKTLIEYIRTAWCRVSTHPTMKVRSAFSEPWNQVSHITAYTRRLDKQQAQLKKNGVPMSDKEKI